jgi:predicted nuclease of predicted toxin-antitoxin system
VKFLLDESAEFRIGEFLAAQGHDVTSIVRNYPRALSDADVLAIAVAEERTIITNDTDFGELVVRDGRPHSGVVLLRLGSGDTKKKIDAVERLLRTHADKMDSFIVVDSRGARVRRT